MLRGRLKPRLLLADFLACPLPMTLPPLGLAIFFSCEWRIEISKLTGAASLLIWDEYRFFEASVFFLAFFGGAKFWKNTGVIGRSGFYFLPFFALVSSFDFYAMQSSSGRTARSSFFELFVSMVVSCLGVLFWTRRSSKRFSKSLK